MRLVRDKNFYRTIFRISLPTAFSSLVSFLVVVADDIMVSSITNGVTEGYGKIAQAAVSQVNALTAFFTATLLGLVSGSSVLISQYWGKKDMPRIKRLFSIVFAVSMAVTLLFVLAARLFPEPVIRLVLRAGDESAAEATRLALAYFAIVCFSWIPYAVTNSLTGMLRSVEVVRVTLYVSVASLVMNISLNYVLIFGKLGLPAMGVEGAALATVLTRVIEMLIVAFYTFRVQKVVDVRPRDFFTFDRALAHDYARLRAAGGTDRHAMVVHRASEGRDHRAADDVLHRRQRHYQRHDEPGHDVHLRPRGRRVRDGGQGRRPRRLRHRAGILAHDSGDVRADRRVHGGGRVPAARAVHPAVRLRGRTRRCSPSPRR